MNETLLILLSMVLGYVLFRTIEFSVKMILLLWVFRRIIVPTKLIKVKQRRRKE